jgi:hypothetical protein
MMTNPEDLLIDPDITPELVEKIKADIKEHEKELKEKNQEDNIVTFAKLIKPLPPFKDEQEAFARPGDVVYAGEFMTLQMTLRANEACRELYLLKYNTVELQKLKLNKENPSQTNLPREHTNYSTLEKPKLKPYVSMHFIEPMINSRKKGRSAQNLELKAQITEFIDFFRNSLFTRDILEVVKIIDSTGMVDRELIYAYLDKISAINQERYELAGSIAQKIREHRG